MNGKFVPEGLYIKIWLADKVFSLAHRELCGGQESHSLAPFISGETAICD